MTTDLQALGDDLFAALSRRAGTTRRRGHRLCVAALVVGAVGVFSATPIASGIADDLNLDPTQWSILGRGSVDNGTAEYVHGQRLSDGSHSTFLVEHDAGLAPYDAFLLHEKTLAAAGATRRRRPSMRPCGARSRARRAAASSTQASRRGSCTRASSRLRR
jgi:hypothetical protein